MKTNTIRLIGVVFTVSLLVVRPAGAATVTGQNGVTASIYSNPFTGSANTFGAIGGGTVVQQSGYPVGNAVNRVSSRSAAGMAALQSSDATQGYMQLTATSPFAVGTVIGDQWLSTLYGTGSAPNNMAYTLRLDGTITQTGPGTPGTHPIQVTTLADVTTVSQLRVEMNLAEYSGSGVRYANFSEAILLPEKMQRIAVSSITQPVGTTAGYPTVNALYDLNGAGTPLGAEPEGGWVGSAGSAVTLDFGLAHTVQALVFAAWEDGSLAPAFTIKNDAGVVIADVTMSAGDYTPIRFDTPVTTSKLTFTFSSATPAMREIIALEVVPIPEPSTVGLLVLGGAVLSYARQRKK